jgi:putative DNA primase/helicase
MAVARQLVKERYWNGQHLLLRRWRAGWWTWGTTCWSEVDEATIRGEAYAFTERAVYLDDARKVPAYAPWAPTRYRIADLLEALAAVAHLRDTVHPPQWISGAGAPATTALVSVANGLLDVRTRQLHAHDPGFFNTVAVPFDYDPAVGADRWLSFLQTLWPDDPESIATLAEFFGYVVSGRTDLQKILLLVGPTRAGKGIIARILKSMIGLGSCAGPTLASLGTNFGLQPLIGKPLAIISDARLGGANVHQVVERLLSVSGEDMLTVDRKFKEPWTGTLPTRFVVVSNELPHFGDASGAIANRFVVLNLTESWLGRENTALTNHLLPELPGILNWSLDGLARLVAAAHFTEPAASRDAVVALQDLASPTAAFVRECCERGPYEVDCRALYGAWQRWAQDAGHRGGDRQVFGRNLHAVIPSLRVSRPREGGNRHRRYQGVKLRDDGPYNGTDRGPARTGPPSGRSEPALVRDGPRSEPLYPLGADDPGATVGDAPSRVRRRPDRGVPGVPRDGLPRGRRWDGLQRLPPPPRAVGLASWLFCDDTKSRSAV